MESLLIDTSEVFNIRLTLKRQTSTSTCVVDSTHGKSQMILTEIETFLEKEQTSIWNLTEVNIHTGPGSFTGLRVGAAVARTLSALLSIPINELSPGSLPHIEYGKDIWKISPSE